VPQSIELRVNGAAQRVDVEADESLLDVLRDVLELTGAKYGCGEGQCGACTVLIDGRATRSCITAIGECVGKSITTIEGLEQDGKLHPLQAAFIECDAMQCGYCTPGMIMSGVALLERNPDPKPDEVARSLNGNICRCGTYGRIVKAVCQAAAAQKGGER
jgi:aerobic-type carbon monoxide dehydrogenase small subunit (CoxS/CutS family)